jgi:hypothetical protein
MYLYYYIYSCAYWVSIKELNERSAPHEYAFLFISIIDLLLLVTAIGLTNLAVGYNLLNGSIVIMISLLIALKNYFIFLRKKKFIVKIAQFKELCLPEFKKNRLRAMVLTFLIAGFLAISVALLNNYNLIKS